MISDYVKLMYDKFGNYCCISVDYTINAAGKQEVKYQLCYTKPFKNDTTLHIFKSHDALHEFILSLIDNRPMDTFEKADESLGELK